MIVLGIETSCDETAAAILQDGHLRSSIVSIQDIHRHFGGVVPEYASRAHIRLIIPAIEAALSKAKVELSQLDGVAVTYGPGLIGSIVVGLSVAKSLALSLGVPWIGVNHLEGHLFANFVDERHPEVPFLCLIISGGHTQLVLVDRLGSYRTIGRTIDDAAGEAFDKVARMLGLGYPGGPAIETVAADGDATWLDFPRAMMGKGNFDFSFSGIKTAILYYVRGQRPEILRRNLKHVAASFEAAVVDVLVQKTILAAESCNVSSVCLAGGVASNRRLRGTLAQESERHNLSLFIPPRALCTDNAAMIAQAGQFYLEQGKTSDFNLSPNPSLKL